MPAPFVQIGRVAVITFGSRRNKLCVIVDIVDANRVLVEGPTTGVSRVCLPVRRLALTRFLVKIPRACKTSCLKKAMEDAKIMESWEKTAWAQKLQKREIRRNMNDFDRFKKNLAKRAINKVIRKNLEEAVAAMDKKKKAEKKN